MLIRRISRFAMVILCVIFASLFYGLEVHGYSMYLQAQALNNNLGTGSNAHAVTDDKFHVDNGIYADSVSAGPVSELGASGFATAQADLATGQIRAYAQASGGGDAVANVGIVEELIDFRWPGCCRTDPIRIGISVDFTAELVATSADPSMVWSHVGDWAYSIGGVSVSANLTSLTPSTFGNDNGRAHVTESIFLDVNPLTDVVNTVISMKLGVRTLGNVQGFPTNGSGFFNGMNTASISLTVPEGVTFRSTSGVFLTQQAASVPELSVLWLASLGLISLSLYKWKRIGPA